MRRHLELAIEGAQLGVWSYNPHTGSCWFSDRSKELWGSTTISFPTRASS